MTAAPTLTTERLTLRPERADDWPAFRDFFAGPRAQFMGGPRDEMTAWGMFCSDAAHWDFYGHGALMIEAESGTVGQVSIIRPPSFPQEELGWFLYEGAEGRGYATEAAAALRAWYYANHPSPVRLVSYVGPGNRASALVAERLGAVPAAGLPPLEDGDVVYLHPAPDSLQ